MSTTRVPQHRPYFKELVKMAQDLNRRINGQYPRG